MNVSRHASYPALPGSTLGATARTLHSTGAIAFSLLPGIPLRSPVTHTTTINNNKKKKNTAPLRASRGRRSCSDCARAASGLNL